jgi:hypothetical protein
MKIFSFGGGVQSMTAMILTVQGKLDYTHFVLANVGDDSENPDTLHYVEQIAKPYAERYGLRLVEVKREQKPGRPQTLYQHVATTKNTIPIPAYMGKGGPVNRICTSDWKIKVVEKWVRQNAGATKSNRVSIGVGISVDESHRMRSDDPQRTPYTKIEYPLIDLMLTRTMCQEIIVKAGLPLAPKSSCWFCPYKKRQEWSYMRTHQPELWQKAIELEQHLINIRKESNQTLVYLTAYNAPIDNVIPLASMNMFDDEDPMACESGYCMT